MKKVGQIMEFNGRFGLITGEKDLNEDEIRKKIEQFIKELKESRNKKIKKRR